MAGTVGKGALLLKDAQGEKSGSLLTFRKKNVAVLRGSLLIALPPKDSTSGADGKPAHNYGVHHEDITLYCEYDDIAPLTNYEFQLLSGISTLGARYDAFISDNHEWGSNLREDEIVYVALPNKEAFANTGCQAVVRWIGTLPGETGIKFGIEIMVCLITLHDYLVKFFLGGEVSRVRVHQWHLPRSSTFHLWRELWDVCILGEAGTHTQFPSNKNTECSTHKSHPT